MRTHRHLWSAITACVALAIASAPAHAQTAQATKASGLSTGTGTFSRTIIDIGSEPNGPITGPFGIMNVQSNVVNVPVTNNMGPAALGVALRDAINAAGLPGYSSRLTAPSGAAESDRPKMTRQTGSFSFSDANSAPGTLTMNASAFTVEDAPATSTPGLLLLGATLALLVWRERRRSRRSA
ncbi:MAG: hypothetical protein HYR74_00485 [Candidatus Eisenbacteria bacterium]|nr:hypothetical protein [Candidatus Eisenbacteria bacterium]